MIPSPNDDQDRMIGSNVNNGSFFCGVIEGFYGRPWTTEQRKLLFKRMELMGMNMYVYAPKLDAKHRSNWRELYSVEEAENFTNLIEAATEHNIEFVYALSPGLDVTFSSSKDTALMKRKLQQVTSFGCKAFALLFDDIGIEMCKDDSEYFQSLAHAQVSITNEIYQHFHEPTFLFCPTEYCAARAVPTVSESEYLKTIGNKLLPGIEIFWTGPMVVSSTINVSSVEELTRLFGRQPLIWDNLHANDYDRKRLFLGPYCGRPSALMPHLKGVLTNPNCEFEANYIDMHTLMQWVHSNDNVSRSDNRLLEFENNPANSDIQLELEDDNSPAGSISSSTGTPPALVDALHPATHDLSYQPRHALNIAIMDWITQVLSVSKRLETSSPISQPADVLAPPIDSNVPDITPVPIENAILSQNLETECRTTELTSSSPIKILLPKPDSNQTVQPEAMDTTITPSTSPTDNNVSSSPLEEAKKLLLDNSNNLLPKALSATHDVEMKSRESSCATLVDMRTACSSPVIVNSLQNDALDKADEGSKVKKDTDVNCDKSVNNNKNNTGINVLDITVDNVKLLVDLYYQPYEHGSMGGHMLEILHWLLSTQQCLHKNKNRNNAKNKTNVGEILESSWHEKCQELITDIDKVTEMTDRICSLSNQAVVYDLFPYLWSIKGMLSLVKSFITWIGCGYAYNCIGTDINKENQNSPGSRSSSPKSTTEWSSRGGLHGDLQSLLPLDNLTDLCNYILPPMPNPLMLNIRPYKAQDESMVYSICKQSCDSTYGCDLYPDLLVDRLIGGFLNLSPEYCFVVEDDKGLIYGYIAATPDHKDFNLKSKIAWLPSLREKYPLPSTDDQPLDTSILHNLHCTLSTCVCQTVSLPSYPAIIQAGLLPCCHTLDPSAARRLLAVTAMALKNAGATGLCAMFDGRDTILGNIYVRHLGMTLLNDLSNNNMRTAARFL